MHRPLLTPIIVDEFGVFLCSLFPFPMVGPDLLPFRLKIGPGGEDYATVVCPGKDSL